MRLLMFGLALLFLSGCGRGTGKADKKSATDKEGVEISKNPFKAAAQASKMADKMAEIQKEIAEMKPVDPVHFDKLIALLPAAPAGYKADDPKGETVEFGEHKHSFAERTYRKDDKTLTVKIHDAAQISAFYAGIAFAAMMKRETTEGYEKGVTIDGNPAIEKYTKANKHGELTVMVAKRFLVEIRADDVAPEFVRTVYDSIDRKALGALK